MRCVSNSFLASGVCFKPADAMRFPIMLLRTARVIIHRFRAESEFVKEDTPVRRDAASAFTVCSSVISTGILENDVDVRHTENAPPCSKSRSPGFDFNFRYGNKTSITLIMIFIILSKHVWQGQSEILWLAKLGTSGCVSFFDCCPCLFIKTFHFARISLSTW